MARIEVEIEDYLDEVDTKYLVRELLKRNDYEKVLIEENRKTALSINDIILPEFKTSDQILVYIKRLLGLKPWHDKDRIISEINNL
jgi:hypothetical protein